MNEINPLPLVDIHTHNFKPSGNITIVNVILADKSDNKNSISPILLRNQKPFTYFSAGIHPWFSDDWETQIKLLEELSVHPKVIALGECGLDKSIKTSLDEQRKILNLQIKLSEKTQKPLIIHCIKAYNELIEIRKSTKSDLPWIIHGFNSSLKVAENCIKYGIYLSFGRSLFNNSLKMTELIQWIPISKLFLETDESDLPIEEIYLKYLKIKGISMNQLKVEMLQNFNTCFKF